MSSRSDENWKRIVNFKKGLPVNLDFMESAKFCGGSFLTKIVEGRVYLVKGLSEEEFEETRNFLFCNPMTEELFEDTLPKWNGEIVEIAYLPGVMDPVALTLEKILGDYFKKDFEVETRRLYLLEGSFNREDAVKKYLSNPIIEEQVSPGSFPENKGKFFKAVINRFNIESKTSKELADISKNMTLSLNAEEMIKIQEYFTLSKKNPTDAELETIAQTWSEHCVHKTLKGEFRFESETIDNLLKSTIFKATLQIGRPDCISVFSDNAGIVSIDGEYAYCVKVETHNHPSALEPYGGAGTGLGGVVRDILGTGLGAKPVASLDVFCTGRADTDYSCLPEGTLHPRRILKGVVSGVRDYGNRIGVPTLCGALITDDRFIANPLVFAGCVGIMPVKAAQKFVKPGDKIILIGGKTGRDGLHGATFSSAALDTESEKKSQGSVQIGNPIEEKKIIEAVVRIRDEELLNAVTDCGAGGLSSAVGEMGSDTGALVRLENVPLKYEYIAPWEIWLSESQERMVIAVPLENVSRVFEICEEEQTNVSVIGEFNDSGKLEVYYYEEKIVDLDMKFLHEGVPRKKIRAKRKTIPDSAVFPEETNLQMILYELLSLPDIGSKEWIIRQYDHQVQGKTVTGPFSGSKQKSHSDGASFIADYGRKEQLAMGLGINVNIGEFDCYKMAYFSIEEALRNLICSGGDPGKAVLLDNFSWGSSEDTEAMGDLVLACKACHDASLNYGTPFISGKDSLNNTYKSGEKTLSIPPTLLITSVSVKEIYSPENSFSVPGDFIYMIGPDPEGIRGSCLTKFLKMDCGETPEIDPEISRKVLFETYHNLSAFSSIHDVSEGGAAVCLAEMSLGGGLGADVEIPDGLDAVDFLYSESPSRFIVTTGLPDIEKKMHGILIRKLGVVTEDPVLKIKTKSGSMEFHINKLERAYFSAKI